MIDVIFLPKRYEGEITKETITAVSKCLLAKLATLKNVQKVNVPMVVVLNAKFHDKKINVIYF